MMWRGQSIRAPAVLRVSISTMTDATSPAATFLKIAVFVAVPLPQRGSALKIGSVDDGKS